MPLNNTVLTFTEKADFVPPGLPLGFWEVNTDCQSAYEVEASGRLIRKDVPTGIRWISNDVTTSFSITMRPKLTLVNHVYTLSVLNGFITLVERSDKADKALHAMAWPWVLEELQQDEDAVVTGKTYLGCIELILNAEQNKGFKTGDCVLDGMIGIALCRPDLLSGATSREALDRLSDHQLRAISRWNRAQL